jgi:hypothetical protein
MNYNFLDTIRLNYFRIIRRKPNYKAFKQQVNDLANSNHFIKGALKRSNPFMVAKLGESELEVLRNYFAIKRNKNKSGVSQALDYLKFGEKSSWTGLETIVKDSGFFPSEESLLDKFAELYIGGIKNIDLFATAHGLEGWYNNNGEDAVINKLNPDANIITVAALDALSFEQIDWPMSLKGKKVLVIHPFQQSIEASYKNREFQFPSPFLPDFELKTFKSVQSIGFTETQFGTWFDALEYMQNEISKIQFDIALIGCGAYGLPLASFIKNQGKQAIHVGGALQLYFGILGSRWENHPLLQKVKNKFWVRPLASETPSNYEVVGNGAKSYW